MFKKNQVLSLRVALPAVLASLLLALGAAGCGSDDSSSEPALTKQEFINKADAICAEASANLPKEFEEFARTRGVRSFESMTKAVFREGVEATGAPSLRKQNAALENLGTPKGDEGETEKFLQIYERAVDAGEENYEVLLKKEAGPFADVAATANKYGFATCGQTP